jgi:hypothetical protein
MRTRAQFGMVVFFLAALVAVALPAAAQTPDAGKWEIELRGGGMWPTNPTGGSITLPGPGPVFTTATGATSPAPSSRRESSWYFGDGAVLFNQAASSLATQAASPLALPARITALDPVLGRPMSERRRGGTVGLSVSRALTRRLRAELSVDYSLARLQVTQLNIDAIEATRASFLTAFDGVIRFNPNRVLNGVTSTAVLEREGGRQLFTSGALIINLRTSGNVIPYAEFGAGVVSIAGNSPRSTLRGNYQFLLPGGAPIDETDIVVVGDTRDDHMFAGILGGGVKYLVSPRWGVRVGARLTLINNSASTVLDATPSVRLGMSPAGRGVLGAEPSIQFSNNSSDPVTALGVTAVAASTLTGPAMTAVRTFSGSGVMSHTAITVGLFWRF